MSSLKCQMHKCSNIYFLYRVIRSICRICNHQINMYILEYIVEHHAYSYLCTSSFAIIPCHLILSTMIILPFYFREPIVAI